METIRAKAIGSVLRTLRRWARISRGPSAHPKRPGRLAVEVLEDRCGPCDLLAASGASLIPDPPAPAADTAATAAPAPQLEVWTAEATVPDEELAAPAQPECAPAPTPASPAQISADETIWPIDAADLLCAEDWPTVDSLFSVPEFAADSPADAIAGELRLAHAAAPSPAEVEWSVGDSAGCLVPQFVVASNVGDTLATITIHGAAQGGAGVALVSPSTADDTQTFGGVAYNRTIEPGAEPGWEAPGEALPAEGDPKFNGTSPEWLPDEWPESTGAVEDAGDGPLEPAGIMPPAENYAATAALPMSQSSAPLSARLNVVAAVPTPHGPVVTPSVVSNSGPDLADSVFRISRTPAATAALEVHYTVSVFGEQGVADRGGTAVIGGGAAQTEVSPFAKSAEANGAELAVFRLHEHRDYRLGKVAATWFASKSLDKVSEAALFTAYRQTNSGEAFNALVERHRDAVYQTCFRLLGNRHDAEDLMQLVFLALARQQVQFQSTLAGWLRTVARNASLTFLRAKRRRTRHEQQTARLDIWHGDDAPELREELEAALSQVCPPLREAVRLRYLDGRSQQDAAQFVGIPRGTLAQRAAKGVHCLRDLLTVRGHLLR
ncbi:MAG: sigma-70 family RNA polymerase sigma factor [Planctomycetia bacterium]|nr:sigma-70 family RNA polymerase sigma factor [Planctomycetia bacterium]